MVCRERAREVGPDASSLSLCVPDQFPLDEEVQVQSRGLVQIQVSGSGSGKSGRLPLVLMIRCAPIGSDQKV